VSQRTVLVRVGFERNAPVREERYLLVQALRVGARWDVKEL